MFIHYLYKLHVLITSIKHMYSLPLLGTYIHYQYKLHVITTSIRYMYLLLTSLLKLELLGISTYIYKQYYQTPMQYILY